ncbi:MAG: ATP-binding protein [Phycisphaeraceae bacterium]
MPRRRLIWKFAPAYLLIIGLSTATVAWWAGDEVRQFYHARTRDELRSQAELMARQIAPLILADNGDDAGNGDAIQKLATELGRISAARVTVIAASGKVLGDSQENPAVMDNHATRPEVVEALAGRVGSSVRFSHTVGMDMMNVARSLRREDGSIIAVVRCGVALSHVSDTLWSVYRRIALGGLIMAGAAALLTLLIFNRQIAQPLRALETGAARFAGGNLSQPLPVPSSREVALLAETLNRMALQLDDKLRTITHQATERQAILASMIEGVIAFDAQGRVITMNGAAARLLDVDGAPARERRTIETIRNADLHRFIARAQAADESVEGDLSVAVSGGVRSLNAHAAQLRDDRGERAGLVIVLHDVTRLQQLETIRQQFVANVSHELKTPITAIKAAVETLMQDSDAFADAAPKFLPIIARQSDRLGAIVEDLLMLARIEQEEQAGQIALSPRPIRGVVCEAVETCRSQAYDKRIEISIDVSPDAIARIDAPLLEQALVNLLDNAVKYSEPGTRVHVAVEREGGELMVLVSDEGPGIEARHLPRIFERFYRTDRARSRSLGGTGLGLSIVKHIAAAHGGRVSVSSIVGKGSVFRIHLPHDGERAAMNTAPTV